jgi:MHS family proline/betaine transporter-like MFS transporter
MEGKKQLIAASVGNMMEWYDFSLYAYFASIISRQFFPSSDQYMSLILTFGTFAIGFLSRPFGAIFFGYIGDKYGRSTSLKLSIYVMVVPTILMGLIPTYHQLGLASPFILLLIRIIQGLSVGGQYSGTLTYLSESAEHGNRGFLTSFTCVFGMLGFLLGSLVAYLLLHVVAERFHEDWVWRIAYLFSIFLFLMMYAVKKNLKETKAFENELEKQTPERILPLYELIKEHPKTMMKVSVLILFAAVSVYVALTFLVTFMQTYGGISLSSALLINTIALLIACIVQPLFALLSDKIGRKPVMIAGCLGGIFLPIPLFLWMADSNIWVCFIGMMGFILYVSAYVSAGSSVFVELFPVHLRYSGSSVCYNIVYAIFGGSAPVVSLMLIHVFNSPGAPGYYLSICGVLALITLFFIPETYKQKW